MQRVRKVLQSTKKGGTLVCDNDSLVGAVNKTTLQDAIPDLTTLEHLDDMTAPNVEFPSKTKSQVLRSEWDILTEIKHTLQKLKVDGTVIQISWIKGHQDRKIDYDELSPSAQLNVDADAIAETFQQTNTAHPYVCLLYTSPSPRDS